MKFRKLAVFNEIEWDMWLRLIAILTFPVIGLILAIVR